VCACEQDLASRGVGIPQRCLNARANFARGSLTVKIIENSRFILGLRCISFAYIHGLVGKKKQLNLDEINLRLRGGVG